MRAFGTKDPACACASNASEHKCDAQSLARLQTGDAKCRREGERVEPQRENQAGG